MIVIKEKKRSDTNISEYRKSENDFSANLSPESVCEKRSDKGVRYIVTIDTDHS